MQISNENKEKISEQILAFLYISFPKPIFTKHIAREIIRDDEFTKKLLLNLKSRNLVIEIKKNPKGKNYIRRSRWRISDIAYKIYKNNQH